MKAKVSKRKQQMPSKIYRKPLKLDMPFNEAIQRLVRVSPIKAKKK
jgi:hypothetical protein